MIELILAQITPIYTIAVVVILCRLFFDIVVGSFIRG